MNRTPRLSRSGIEYLDYVWNFYSGCRNSENGVCPLGKNCWARKITERFKQNYPNGFEPTFYPEAFLSPLHLKKPSIIGVAFMGDLFGDWINYTDENGTVTPKNIVYPVVERCPQHTFLFKTKCPWNLPKWGKFPDNCWVGVTATGYDAFNKALDGLKVIEAKVKFISIEPLLEAIPFYMERLAYCGINQLIIGACTGTKAEMSELVRKYPDLTLMPYGKKWTAQPQISWVEEIVRAADKAGIPVFLKNNLMPLVEAAFGRENYLSPILTPDGDLRQEIPGG